MPESSVKHTLGYILGGCFSRASDHEFSDLINGLIPRWIHNEYDVLVNNDERQGVRLG